jgi:hypothetical protein
MDELEVFVLKLLAINRLASNTGAVGEISSLAHEIFDNTVENRVFEVEWFVGLWGNSLLSRTESTEVLSGLRDNGVVELENYTALRRVIGGNIKVNDGHIENW